MQNTDTPISPAIEPEKRSNRSAMMIVFLVVFIDLLGFGIVLPLLPLIAKSYVTLVFPENRVMVGLIVGLLMSSFSLMQFLFAPVWGKLSDRIGRRPILLVGLLGSVVFYMMFGYATSLSHDTDTTSIIAMAFLFMARIGAGVSGATIATAQAVIADCTPPEKRKHGMALIGAAFGIGFTCGPLIGFGCLWISNDLSMIGYTAAGLSLLALLLGLRLLPETRVFNTEPFGRRKLVDLAAIRQVLVDPAIGPIILVFFMASLGFGAFEVTLAMFLEDTFRFDKDNSFLIFAYIGFVLMLTQGVLYRRLASRVSETTFIAMGILFMALGVAIMGGINLGKAQGFDWALRMEFLFAALTAAVVGFAFLTPSAQALISRRTSSERQGEILGVNQSASAMARILGPVFGVTLYTSTESHLLPYIAGAVLLVLMLPLLPRIRRGSEPEV